MIPGTGAAGLPSSSPASPAGDGSPAAPSRGPDVCSGCGAVLDLRLVNVGSFGSPSWREAPYCFKCKLIEDGARSEDPDAADLFEDLPPSAREAGPSSVLSGALSEERKPRAMPSRMLRAYLCTKALCAMMGTDLAQWAATKERAVLILPGSWLSDPSKAPEGFARLVREDRKTIYKSGTIDFPVLVEDPVNEKGGPRVVRDSDWLAFSRE